MSPDVTAAQGHRPWARPPTGGLALGCSLSSMRTGLCVSPLPLCYKFTLTKWAGQASSSPRVTSRVVAVRARNALPGVTPRGSRGSGLCAWGTRAQAARRAAPDVTDARLPGGPRWPPRFLS